jgi:arylsulfatase
MMVKWPGKIKPGQVSNEIISMEDWLPTLLAAAGEPDIKEQLLKGHRAGGKRFNVHLDGYNFLPYFTGEAANGPRQEMFYFTDDGQLSALRYGQWKLMFTEQRAHGMEVWQDPYVTLRFPKLFNLLRDPFERADWESGAYETWRFERLFLIAPAAAYVGRFIATFKDYPPRAEPGTFNLDRVMKSLQKDSGGSN